MQLELRPRVVCDLDRVLLVDVERDARFVRLQLSLARVEHRLGRVEHLRLAVAQVGVLDRHPAVFGHTDLRARVRLHVHRVGAGGGLEAPARLHDLRPEIIVPRRHRILKHVTLEARPAASAGEQPRDSAVAGVALQRQQPGRPAVHRHAFRMFPPAGEQPRDSTVAGVACNASTPAARPPAVRSGRPAASRFSAVTRISGSLTLRRLNHSAAAPCETLREDVPDGVGLRRRSESHAGGLGGRPQRPATQARGWLRQQAAAGEVGTDGSEAGGVGPGSGRIRRVVA